MVEKPRPQDAPSNFFLNGRYVLQPEIFGILARQQRGAGNEIQLTDGMLRLSKGQPFHAHPYEGRTFDCGSKQGFIEANVALAFDRPDIGGTVFESVRDMVLSHQGRIRAA
jgi:UTP--glucose-1-phosphate uridylyltransferase